MTAEGYKEYVKPFETGDYFRDSVKETLGDISPASIKRFCADPALSDKIAGKASEKKFGKYPAIQAPKKKNGPVAEGKKEKPMELMNGPQP